MTRMRSLVSLALWSAILSGLSFTGAAADTSAVAAPSARLSRPFEPSRMAADGRLEVSSGATIGNLTVDNYAYYTQKIASSKYKREYVIDALKTFMCPPGGVGLITKDAVDGILKGMSKEARASLRSRDANSLSELSIAVIAKLDGISADRIRADEAIGPGAYHDAVTGLSIALDVCNFVGRP